MSKKPTQYEVEDLLEAAKAVYRWMEQPAGTLLRGEVVQAFTAAINAVGGSECSDCGVTLLGSNLCSSCYAEAEATDRAIDEEGCRHE